MMVDIKKEAFYLGIKHHQTFVSHVTSYFFRGKTFFFLFKCKFNLWAYSRKKNIDNIKQLFKNKIYIKKTIRR